MASLNDSKTFQALNKSASITSKIAKIVASGVVLDRSYIEEQYLQISKTRISPISTKILNAFDSGKIRLIWNKEIHLTIAVPFVVLNIGGASTACIFISDFSSINKEGSQLTIDMKKLYTLMESAYIGLQYFTAPDKFVKTGSFMKLNASIYSSMVLRILNREYALSLDKDAYDFVNYASSRFFLRHVMGLKNEDLCHSYAISTCKSPSESNMRLAEDLYVAANPQTIEELVEFFKKNNPKMGDLKYRYFFERWISSYGTGACLSIDSYPYFYYVIANVILGGFLVNVTGLSEIIKNMSGINKFYSMVDHIIQ